MIIRTVIFLVLNFAALAIGGFFTGKGVPSDWYLELNKAPWTPPGWVFGFMWTLIMACFSVYMAYVWPTQSNKVLLISLFAVQWVLNVGWNPAFFYAHQVLLGLVIISCLTLIMTVFLIYFWKDLQLRSVLVFPYVLWLIIATSLNGYVYFNN